MILTSKEKFRIITGYCLIKRLIINTQNDRVQHRILSEPLLSYSLYRIDK